MIAFEKITAYKISSNLSDDIWRIVRGWSVLAQKTLGEQLVRSIDSVAANIIEGEGRYFKKDKVKFFYQARGSAFEAIHWIEKAYKRSLLVENDYKSITKTLNELPKELNYLISNTMKNLKK